ncbi:MAG TPA: lipase maturation factor family protein [Polyangiales bacterium]|jgi:hypothetical protein|nr:lipase maturation factor family protein [Polyangiales bacterium]
MHFRGEKNTQLVCDLFVRGLGVIYLVAFASLSVQVIGLIGARGIAPAAELLAEASGEGLLELPTWLWWTGTSDRALRGLCFAGMGCSLAVAAHRLPRIALFGAWSLYLSLCAVGDVFFSFQWDVLLLECGLVGLFVATPGSRLGLWLARALCFKLMLLSGIVKLRSGDPTWRDLSALSYHFWTQPLPAWPALWADALPQSCKAALTWLTLAIELIAPLGIFGPRRVRLVAAALLALLQLVIAATGSYGFFNLLSLLLCMALLDDAALPARIRTWLARRRAAPSQQRYARVRTFAQELLAVLLLAASLVVATQRILPLPAAVRAAVAWARPLRSINSYGLFAVMTTQRHEIALEGSVDGIQWRRYHFRWKPDELERRPRFSAPHMPRLDWQMWFAALGRCEQQGWFLAFLSRVLEGSPDVLELLRENPFPDHPPRYVRTPLANYRFSEEKGVWWQSTPLPDFCPTATLREGRLMRADDVMRR